MRGLTLYILYFANYNNKENFIEMFGKYNINQMSYCIIFYTFPTRISEINKFT